MIVQELNYAEYELLVAQKKLTSEQVNDVIKTILTPAIWLWLLDRWEDKIFVVKLWFIKKTVRVKDLSFVWRALFGPPPVPQP